MAAEKNNKYWQRRNKHGKNPNFTPDELWEAACDYFQMCDDNPEYETKLFSYMGDVVEGRVPKKMPYTIGGLTIYLGVNERYLAQLPDNYSTIVEQIKTVIYNQKFVGAAQGFFDSNIIARDLGLKDKTDNEQKISFKNGINLNVNFQDFSDEADNE